MLKIEVEPEIDRRWIGEVPALPGVMAYGATKREVRSKVAALALRVIADLVAHGELLLQEAGEPFALWPTNK